MTPLFFNNAGPSVPELNYMLDPLTRLNLSNIERLIAQQRYFVLHAPRQTGKTTCLLALMAHLNAQGNYRALYANIEAAQALREDVPQAIQTVCSVIAHRAKTYLKDTRLIAYLQDQTSKNPGDALTELLTWWTETSDKPTVLFLDEIDALVGDTLISVLRQIRSGYAQRPAAFPISIVLCGVRDVRDYRIQTSGKDIITGGSAFNIKTTSLRLGNFTQQEVETLWQQHTQETGQTFAEAIYPELWTDTRGQPWLVNALAWILTEEMSHLADRQVPVTLEDYRVAREELIQSRATHLDQLTDKLKEPRVHQIIANLLTGTGQPSDMPTDDAQYVADLGLATLQPEIRIANRIYQEVIPRELIWTSQATIAHQQHWYLTPERWLDMPRLLQAFQQFFREHSDAWIQQFDYKEAGPQLLLQAFLQRIVNGGGRISREYGLGRKRTDLYIEWPVDEQAGFHGEIQHIVLELKIRYGSLETTLADGLLQTADYATQCGAEEAHLLIFDRRADVSWDDKIWHQTKHQDHRTITVWGL
ncbi:MAG: AAA-like domain-containing protein [Pseudomonadota bacterium]